MSKIYVDEILPKDNSTISAPNLDIPAGTIIQQVHSRSTTDITISGTAGWVSVFTGTITPKYANSKIYIEMSLAHGVRSSGEHQFDHRIYSSNSTDYTHALTSGGGSSKYDVTRHSVQGGGAHWHSRFVGYEELNMGSITEITYDFQIYNPATSYPDIRVNFSGRAASVMTIQEIKV